MKKRKIIVAFVLLFVLLCFFRCEKRTSYSPSEEQLWSAKEKIEEMTPIIEYGLNMNYFEDERIAGFSYNDLYPDMPFAFYMYFVLKMSDLSGKELSLSRRKHYIDVINTKNITSFSLDDLFFLSELLHDLEHSDYDEEIAEMVEAYWNEEEKMYDIPYQNENKDILTRFAVTWYAFEILENVNTTSPHTDSIIEYFDKNVSMAYSEYEAPYAGLMIRLADRLKYDSVYKINFIEWTSSMGNSWSFGENIDDDMDVAEDLFECAKIYKIDISRFVELFEKLKMEDFVPYGYDERVLRPILQYYILCEENNVKCKFPSNIGRYIETAEKTDFAIRANVNISSLYTYYGLVLSDEIEYPINMTKIKAYVNEKIEGLGVLKQTVITDEYVMDALFTLMCAKELGIPIEKEKCRVIADNLSGKLHSLDYLDMSEAYGNLYIIQFCYECFILLDMRLVNRFQVKKYIKLIEQSELCKDTIYISDLKLIYDIMGIKIGQSFERQIDETITNLSLRGGFCFNREMKKDEITDIVSTAKMWRILPDNEKTTNKEFFARYLSNGKMAGERGRLFDLRSLYYLIVYAKCEKGAER